MTVSHFTKRTVGFRRVTSLKLHLINKGELVQTLMVWV